MMNVVLCEARKETFYVSLFTMLGAKLYAFRLRATALDRDGADRSVCKHGCIFRACESVRRFGRDCSS